MAKKKKLNKRALILLGALGAVAMAAIVVAVVFYLPKDHKRFAEMGEQEYKKGNYQEAAKDYSVAINAASKEPISAVYMYKLAVVQWDWATTAPNMGQTERQKHVTDAIGMLLMAVRKDSSYLDAQRKLADIYWKIESSSGGEPRWEDYIDQADKLLALAKDDHVTYFRRGFAKSRKAEALHGEWVKAAVDDFDMAISLKPDEPNYRLVLAQFLQSQGMLAEAEKTYQEAIKTIPDNASLRVGYATLIRSQTNKPDSKKRAMEQLQAAADRDKKNPLGLLTLAGFQINDNQLDDALKTLEQARQVDDGNYAVYGAISEVYLRKTEPEKAIAALREGIAAIGKKIQDSSATSQPADRIRLDLGQGELYYRLANLLLYRADANPADKAKIIEEARGCLDQISRVSPESPQALKIAGRIAMVEGKTAEAIKFLEDAYEKLGDTVDGETSFFLINQYQRQGLLGKAEKIIDRLLKTPAYRQHPVALVAKAKLLMGYYRDYKQAQEYLNQARQVDPKNAEVIQLQTDLDMATGKLPLPQHLDPSQVSILADKAWLMYLGGQREDGIKLMTDVYDRAPENAAVATRLVDMLLGAQQKDEAQRILKKAAAADPTNEEMKFRLKVLAESDPQKQMEMLLSHIDSTPGMEPSRKALARAQVLQTFNQEDQVLRTLTDAAKENPADKAVIDGLFAVAVRNKKWDLAKDCVAKATAGNLDGFGGRFRKAQLLIAQESWDEAVPLLEGVVKDNPESKEVQTVLGQCYLHKGDLSKAEEAFQAVVTIDPVYVPAVVGMARVTQAEGKAEYANWVLTAYRLAPGDKYIQESYIALELDQKNPQEAIRRREMIRAGTPTDLQNRVNLAFLYERTKQMDKAEEELKFVFDNAGDKVAAFRLLGGYYVRTGRSTNVDRLFSTLLDQPGIDKVGLYLAYGDFMLRYSRDTARGLYQKAIDADAADARGYRAMAAFLADAGQYTEAAERMDQYVQRKPGDLGAKKLQCQYLIQARNYDAALKRLKQLSVENGRDGELLSLQGLVELLQDHPEEAMRLYDESVQIAPENVNVRVNRAKAYLSLNRPKDAQADLEEAKKNTDSPEVSMLLSAAMVKLDSAKAIVEMEDLHTRLPDYTPAVDQLIQLYMKDRKWSQLEAILAEQKRAHSEGLEAAKYLMAEAQMWSDREDKEKEMAAVEAARKAAPENPGVQMAYLMRLEDRKKYDLILAATDQQKNPALLAYRAMALAKTEKIDEADRLFISILKDSEQRQQLEIAFREIATAYGAAKGAEKAGDWVQRYAADKWLMWALLSDLYARKEANNPQGALDMLRKAMSLATRPEEKTEVNRRIGSLYYQMKNYAEAEKAYLAVIAIVPESSASQNNDLLESLNNLAYLYTSDLNQPEKALPYAEKALKIRPDDGNIQDTLGWTLVKLKRLSDAQPYLEGAIETRTAAAFYHLGCLREQQDRFSDASKMYRLASEKLRDQKDDPLYQPVADSLKRVQQKLESK